IHKIGVRAIAANKHITLQPTYEANLEQHNTISEILTTDIPYSQILYNTYIPAMHLAPIEHNIRRLIRHLQNAQAVAKWHSQGRMQCWKDYPIDWTMTTHFISYKDKPTARTTHPQKSQLKSFKIKLILDELPTYKNLNHRHPSTYPDPTCPRCKSHTEDNNHWAICSANSTTLQQIITNTLDTTYAKFQILPERKLYAECCTKIDLVPLGTIPIAKLPNLA